MADTVIESPAWPVNELGEIVLDTGDYIEVFVTNSTAANNVTVSDLNVIIERLN